MPHFRFWHAKQPIRHVRVMPVYQGVKRARYARSELFRR